MYYVIALYTLNLHIMCQLCLNKAGENEDENKIKSLLYI